MIQKRTRVTLSRADLHLIEAAMDIWYADYSEDNGFPNSDDTVKTKSEMDRLSEKLSRAFRRITEEES
jgi:hypothetical protein